MELNEQQKKTVAGWFAAGESLDGIQKRIKSEFGIHMTYLDVRLMVADLPQPEEIEKVEEPASEANPQQEGEQPGDGQPDEGQPDDGQSDGEQTGEEEQSGTVPNVTVTADALMIPGTLVSGDVTFSDGKKGKWYLDQMGRLGLGGDLPEGYRPSQADMVVFQQQLMGVLHSKGLA